MDTRIPIYTQYIDGESMSKLVVMERFAITAFPYDRYMSASQDSIDINGIRFRFRFQQKAGSLTVTSIRIMVFQNTPLDGCARHFSVDGKEYPVVFSKSIRVVFWSIPRVKFMRMVSEATAAVANSQETARAKAARIQKVAEQLPSPPLPYSWNVDPIRRVDDLYFVSITLPERYIKALRQIDWSIVPDES